jgi:hypothetical protein
VIVFKYHREFLQREFGEDVAKQIRLDELRYLWDLLARLYILRGKPNEGVMGFSVQTILENLAFSRKRLMWKLCFALPHPLSRWLFLAQANLLEVARSLARSRRRPVAQVGRG